MTVTDKQYYSKTLEKGLIILDFSTVTISTEAYQKYPD